MRLSLAYLQGTKCGHFFFFLLKDSILEGKIQVVREAKGQVPVFLDSGIRRGTDVFKALALGASEVFVSPLLVLQHLIDRMTRRTLLVVCQIG